MIYKVTAKLIEGKAKEFYQKLTDGTIQKQQPDGQEIIDSMQRALIQKSGRPPGKIKEGPDSREGQTEIGPKRKSGLIVWSECCYCPTPLAHERATVLDHYFSDLTTELIDDYEEYEGDSFWDYLTQEK